MKKRAIISWLTLLLSLPLFSQTFQGRIIDQSGNPVVGSTVYIREIKQGVACSDDGEFQVALDDGTYTVEFRSLGYETQTKNITVRSGEPVAEEIVLEEKYYALSEVVVVGREDPAYEIMRQAIARAPYHAKQIKSYQSEVYQKLKLKLLALPNILGMKMETNDGLNLNDYKNKLFIQESYNDITYTAPDKYEQTVKAFSSSIPDDMNPDDALRITQSSLYQPVFAGMTSPLHPKAFSYYRFRYEGFVEEDGQVINKIKVTPKLKDPLFISGYIYIADGEWNLRFAELRQETMGMTNNYTITYNPVAESVYMPTSYMIDSRINVMGFKAEGSYLSSSKYTEVIQDETLVSGAVTLPEAKKKEKRSFELKPDSNYIVQSDTLAKSRDSLFWKKIRTLPLSDDEWLSYQRKDSIQAFTDSIKKNYHNKPFRWGSLLMGGKIGGDSARFSLKYDGLLRVIPEYNFVDGYWVGQEIDWGINVGKDNALHVIPSVYYATARKRVLWQTRLTFDYAPLRFGHLSLSMGSTTSDYNPVGALRIENALNSLLWGKNRSMLYQNDYIRLENNLELTHALRLAVELDLAKRRSLENKSSDILFGKKKDVTPNLVTDERFDRISYAVGLTYHFNQYYEIRNGRKIYRRNYSPAVNLRFSRNHPVNNSANENSQYMELGMEQRIKTDLLGLLVYSLNGGSFIGSRDRMNFADYKHFNTSDLMFTGKNGFDSFMLLDYYSHSTNKHWVQGIVNYNNQYIFLKRLPFLQGRVFSETIGAKFLYTPDRKGYTEFGYSIGLGKLMSVGVFGSFNELKHDKTGVKFSLDLSMF